MATDTSGTAVDALAQFLMERDWPTKHRLLGPGKRHDYRCQAAAILNGEAWAIRKAWPKAAFDIATSSERP